MEFAENLLQESTQKYECFHNTMLAAFKIKSLQKKIEKIEN